jgi:hypothetical protein
MAPWNAVHVEMLGKAEMSVAGHMDSINDWPFGTMLDGIVKGAPSNIGPWRSSFVALKRSCMVLA